MKNSLIKYDQPIEVTREQYQKIVPIFSEIIAHRNQNGRYYIKLWVMAYKSELQKALDESD